MGFGVQAGVVDGPTLCRLFYDAIARKGTPTYLSTNNDPLYLFHQWQANLRILEIDEIKTIPDVPLSHPFVDRLIGSLRRELLDQVLFWNTPDLERKQTEFQHYFNGHRVHLLLHGVTPMNKAGKSMTTMVNLHNYQWQSCCRGLFELPIAA